MRTFAATVTIGGFPMRLVTADEAFHRVIEQRYGTFIKPVSEDDGRLDIELVPLSSLPEWDHAVTVAKESGVWLIRRSDFQAQWDPLNHQGHVRQAAVLWSIDSVLRIIHSVTVAAAGGFLLHSASAVRNGRAVLFSGQSGAGKTTIARLLPRECRLLTDEISYVLPHRSGYHAFGTPFMGDLGVPGEDESAAVNAAYLLAKGPENRVDPVSEDAAARALLRNVLFFATEATLVRKVFETICEFVTRVPVYRLTFYPDARVWDVIP